MHKLSKALLTLLATSVMTWANADEAEVTLKVHHFLPAHSVTQADFLKPWAEKITAESNGRIQFQFYPSMQLGGTPPQLIDQARDGVADIVWTLPGYTSGRFPLASAFEMPFMSRSSEASSQAMWDFLEAHGQKEFADVHLLATHLTDGALLHTAKKPVRSLADFRGLKLRSANRISTKLISMLGATPVAMPVPQVPEALSKGVVDGAVLPWDVVPALKLQELVKYHTEMAPGQPALMHTALVLAMNPAKYASLPDDLRKIIDDNSGREISRQAGHIWDTNVIETGHKLAEARGNEIYVLPAEEQAKWMAIGRKLDNDWIKEVESKGNENGAALLQEVRDLIESYNAKLPN
ncbi:MULTISPECIES: TRAP transporter substrate-binding protein [Pseudomonas]|uniref:C4-dicarboxylate ABC transporter n=1 Tax=Pseudomonas sediminis TaxID=1691904 RepID=A0A2G5FER1_9PSED|nr:MULTISPECIES: TRAP transporter substrate-binding protein [Pseudomonas]MDU9409270.1 TRAP transporter substrate-binding protein [Pseudomonas sp. zfem001]PIA66488.1 C4-dicarboxylate ABC transporter [Pseudomonas sediminis]PKQ41625.1 C4-dicarboxylate ABC transporter [Pseudomonas sp. YY-1]RRV41483.1 C4-dicarboxylate ABC transporter [Pseudomonas sp. o96-267]TRO23557.1 TRAP transporter substrate-binding protein [Pseudomonas mendocina]